MNVLVLGLRTSPMNPGTAAGLFLVSVVEFIARCRSAMARGLATIAGCSAWVPIRIANSRGFFEMIKRLPQILFTLFAMTSLGTIASAQVEVGQLVIGSLTFQGEDVITVELLNETGPLGSSGITTSTGAFVAFTDLNLVLETTLGKTVTLSSADFAADSGGTPGSLQAINTTTDGEELINDGFMTSAVLTGQLNPSTGLLGLPYGVNVSPTFTAVIDPPATSIAAILLPEPGAWGLIFALTGLALIWRAAPWCWRRFQSTRLMVSTVL
jgi:hypothetical protein